MNIKDNECVHNSQQQSFIHPKMSFEKSTIIHKVIIEIILTNPLVPNMATFIQVTRSHGPKIM